MNIIEQLEAEQVAKKNIPAFQKNRPAARNFFAVRGSGFSRKLRTGCGWGDPAVIPGANSI